MFCNSPFHKTLPRSILYKARDFGKVYKMGVTLTQIVYIPRQFHCWAKPVSKLASL